MRVLERSDDIVEDVILSRKQVVKPILKWAGGKTQLIPELIKRFPIKYNRYIEPFIGGGALFFYAKPRNSIIGDINPELINLYDVVKNNTRGLIKELKEFKNNEEYYYDVRRWNVDTLSNEIRAARTIFLNKTCFNGLYRVNKKGEFNTPYGNYRNPNIVNEDGLKAASEALKDATLVNLNYKDTLLYYALPGDFIYLDPPYLPISKYEDFKRYTKEGFYEEDHIELAKQVKSLSERGCHVILTNSNSPLVYELYSEFDISVVQTRRYVNSNASKRTGEDVIICAPPKIRKIVNMGNIGVPIISQIKKFPSTRYMGSKQSLLKQIATASLQFEFETVLDLFSGSGVVSYMFKSLGKTVISNDYMKMNSVFSSALIENSTTKLSKEDLKTLLSGEKNNKGFVSNTFKDLYYTDEDNSLIDLIRENIDKIENKGKKNIALYALIRACLKKRPRGIYTYTGIRYDDGRKDLQMSFEDQFIQSVKTINAAVFDNTKKNKVLNIDSMDVNIKSDLVYLDPPYYSLSSDNEYVRRYHFVEGLARNWEGLEIQWETKTRKFKNYPTPFSTRNGAYDAFDKLFSKHKNSILVVSYSSNSIPSRDEMLSIMSKYKTDVEVIAIDHTYSFGNQGVKINNNKNRVQEYIFVGY